MTEPTQEDATIRELNPERAVDRLEAIYGEATTALSEALDNYLLTRQVPSAKERLRFCYPILRVVHREVSEPRPINRRAFAKLQRSGVYETTITHPQYFRSYLLEQLVPLVEEFGAEIEVARSDQEIPYPYVFERTQDIVKAGVQASELARYFPAPDLAGVADDIADGVADHVADGPYPLALFDAARTDYSLRRLVHYTGTDWRHFQRWVLLTNYHRYVDQFIQLAVEQLLKDGTFEKLVMPANTVIEAGLSATEVERRIRHTPWHRYQMPSYHLVGPDGEGVTLVNIGVGPSNAKNITDHLAVLRPHCWLMVGHCGGLRESQSIGDYVLAHAYLRQDHILDSLVPPDVPIPALAEIQIALQEAAAGVTGQHGDALKQRLRTGTVVTNDDRNWELRFAQERRRINLSRAIAVDMESGTIAAQGFRLRVPYGTLLCVSDKPLHGEIKLPGAANAFYETAVAQHLKIGLAAIDLLKRQGDALHSRKLRSFEEPPFR